MSRRGRSGRRVVNRGEVWLAVLDPTVGSEIQKTRPCLIVSPPEINDYLHTSIVVPMTTGGRAAPYRIPVNFRGRAGLIVLDQLRSIDEQRLVRPLGTVAFETLRTALAALREMFDE